MCLPITAQFILIRYTTTDPVWSFPPSKVRSCGGQLFLASTTVVFIHFAEGSKTQFYNFVREPHKIFNTSQLKHFFYNTKSVTQNIRGVAERLLRTAQRMLGSCTQLLEHCLRTFYSTCNTNPASYNATTLAMIKSRKQSREDRLL